VQLVLVLLVLEGLELGHARGAVVGEAVPRGLLALVDGLVGCLVVRDGRDGLDNGLVVLAERVDVDLGQRLFVAVPVDLARLAHGLRSALHAVQGDTSHSKHVLAGPRDQGNGNYTVYTS
jgi:hypothetical protein